MPFPSIQWYQWFRGLGRRPVVQDDDLYILIYDQYASEYQLHALNRSDGQRRWVCPLPAGGYASPAVDHERVYTPLSYSRLGAVDRKTGSLCWTLDFGSRLRSTPTLANERLFTVTANRFIEIDPAEGRILRERVLPGRFAFGQVQVCDGFAYFLAVDRPEGSGSRLLATALDLDALSPVWETAVGPGLVVSSDSSGLAVGADAVYTGSADGKVYALDLRDGSVRWTVPTSSVSCRSTPCFAHGRLYVGNLAGSLTALDGSTGQLLWKRHLDAEGIWAPPTVANSLVMAHAGNDLYVVDEQTGDVLSSVPVGHAPYTGIEVADNEIYICGGDPPDAAMLFRFALEDLPGAALKTLSTQVSAAPGGRRLTAEFQAKVHPDETIKAVRIDMRPLGGQSIEPLCAAGENRYALRTEIPSRLMHSSVATVAFVETDRQTYQEPVGFALTDPHPTPAQHLIADLPLEPQERMDDSGPAVLQALMARLGKTTSRDEVYRKGNYIVSRGLDPHHKWRSGAQRILQSQSGEFPEMTGAKVDPERLFD